MALKCILALRMAGRWQETTFMVIPQSWPPSASGGSHLLTYTKHKHKERPWTRRVWGIRAQGGAGSFTSNGGQAWSGLQGGSLLAPLGGSGEPPAPEELLQCCISSSMLFFESARESDIHSKSTTLCCSCHMSSLPFRMQQEELSLKRPQ